MNVQPNDIEPIDYQSVKQLCQFVNPHISGINTSQLVYQKLSTIDFKRYVPRLVNDINYSNAWILKDHEPEVVKRFINKEGGPESLDFIEFLKPETILKCLTFVPPITEEDESIKILQKAYPLARLHCNHTEIISTILTSLNPKYPIILNFSLDQLSLYIDKNCLINLSKILYTLNNLMIHDIFTKPFEIQQQIIKLKIPIIYTYVYDFIGCWKICEKNGHQIDYTNLKQLASSINNLDHFNKLSTL
ncbi:unnamed protein product [Candida verbasci]|uniref:Uncharacterized protein n=1 Tax=Candida verbasci TaxID=1227364 RepID=A0A9W4TVU3_9ASCO|nr:unnamed protein product [Candida verbasci]